MSFSRAARAARARIRRRGGPFPAAGVIGAAVGAAAALVPAGPGAAYPLELVCTLTTLCSAPDACRPAPATRLRLRGPEDRTWGVVDRDSTLTLEQADGSVVTHPIGYEVINHVVDAFRLNAEGERDMETPLRFVGGGRAVGVLYSLDSLDPGGGYTIRYGPCEYR